MHLFVSPYLHLSHFAFLSPNIRRRSYYNFNYVVLLRFLVEATIGNQQISCLGEFFEDEKYF